MVWEEAELVVKRVDALMAKEATLLQAALGTIPQQGMKKVDLQKRMKVFVDQIKSLTED